MHWGRLSCGAGKRIKSQRTKCPPLPVAAAVSRQDDPVPADAVARAVAAATRAPSGGNVQPWRISADATSITITLAPEHTSTMDVGYRGSAVAIGAAAYNARVAAAAHARIDHGDLTALLYAQGYKRSEFVTE